MLLLQLKNCHLIFRFYPLPFPVASQSSARAVSTHALSERMKEMSERIEAMDQITQNMDREFKSSRVVSTRLIYQQNGNVSWRRRTQIKQLAWPMAEWQIGHRKSSLVLSARFPVVKWRSRSVAKSAYYLNMDREFKSSRVVSTICNTPLLVCGIVTEDVPVSSLRSKRLSFHFSRGQNQFFFLTLVIVPEVFAKVNLAQSPFPFQSGESVCNFTYHKHSLSFYNPR